MDLLNKFIGFIYVTGHKKIYNYQVQPQYNWYLMTITFCYHRNEYEVVTYNFSFPNLTHVVLRYYHSNCLLVIIK